jgi:hypothetical protein
VRGNFQKMPTKWNDAEILWGVQGVGGVETRAMYSMASSYNMGTSFARETRSILRFGIWIGRRDNKSSSSPFDDLATRTYRYERIASSASRNRSQRRRRTRHRRFRTFDEVGRSGRQGGWITTDATDSISYHTVHLCLD